MIETPDWLTPEEKGIYLHTLPAVLQPVTPEKKLMLAAYANAVANYRRTKRDKAKARIWRGVMIFARNGLGFGAPYFIDLVDLLIDCGNAGEHGACEHLEERWQLERPVDYLTAPLNY